jgi:acyl-CoA synthetase (NDP forming)
VRILRAGVIAAALEDLGDVDVRDFVNYLVDDARTRAIAWSFEGLAKGNSRSGVGRGLDEASICAAIR